MKYEYHPLMLKAWMRDNRSKALKQEIVDVNQKYKSVLVNLKEEFETIVVQDEKKVGDWAANLSKRQKLLLPNLYQPSLEKDIKETLLNIIRDNVKNEKRMFRVLVDCTFQTCDLDDLWTILKHSFAIHHDKLIKRMDSIQSDKWNKLFLDENPIHYLAQNAYESEKGFMEELESFYLNDNFPLYKLVLMDAFSFAGEEFFIEEKVLYKKYFQHATNEEQQKLTHSLISNCRLNQVQDLGKFIYEKLKTYRRKPMLWGNVGEYEKKRFASWILKLELKDFFGSVNKNHERFIYWEKFISKLEDVVVTDQKKTLIMYFSDAVIMEVLGTGAVYIYSPNTFQRKFQDKIDRMLVEIERSSTILNKPREIKRHELMDRDLVINSSNSYNAGRLSHNADWQTKFDNWLQRNLQWEVRKHVLLQQAKRDEG